jgi:predicted nucleic acid-binding protein
LFVDTSTWSMALRRDSPSSSTEVHALLGAIESGEAILTTGIVLQELCKAFGGRERATRSWIDSARQGFHAHRQSLPIEAVDSVSRIRPRDSLLLELNAS